MSKYRRWEYVERAVPLWLEQRQRERAARLRASHRAVIASGLRCEECFEIVPAAHFVEYEGVCARCWSGLQGG